MVTPSQGDRVKQGAGKTVVLLLITAAVTVSLFLGISRGFHGSGKPSPQLAPPPNEPPPVYLLVRKGQEVYTQKGVLFLYDWTMEGKLEKYKMGHPWQWPLSLPASERDAITLRIDTPAAPVLIQVSLYSRLGPEGIPEDESLLLECRNAQLYTGTHHPCDLVYEKVEGREGWEIDLPLRPTSGTVFLTVWALWVSLADLSQQYSANWYLSAHKLGRHIAGKMPVAGD